MCGALKWRPHIWLTGGAGCGKSTVLDKFAHHLMGGVDLFVQGNSTEAGIRQTLMADARPVLFDESESNEESDARRVQNVLSLIRQSSTESEAQTLKGTAGGQAMNFHIRSMFCLASIQVALKQQADIERLTVLALRPKRDDTDAAGGWVRISEQLYEIHRDTTLPARLFRRSMNLLPTTLKNIIVFCNAAAEKFNSQRDGDQYGTMLAGAWSLISTELATKEQAMELINSYDWSEHRENNDTDEGQRALASLFGAFVRVRAGIELTVRELVCAAYGDASDTVDVTQATADAILQRYGMKVKGDRLMLSNNHDALKKLMDGTTFAADYRGVLLRVEGADRCDNKPSRFNGVNTKCFSLPLGPIVSSDRTTEPAF
jgi:putative DNA primase/helicase